MHLLQFPIVVKSLGASSTARWRLSSIGGRKVGLMDINCGKVKICTSGNFRL